MTDPGSASGRVTSEIRRAGDTQPLDAPAPRSGGGPLGILSSHEWREAATAAGLAWLAVLCVGAVATLAPKLQFPAFGRGADPIEILTVVVVMSLGLFGVPVHIGGVTISALPLGATLTAGIAIGWATRAAAHGRSREIADARRHALRVAAIFAVAALLISLVFRLRGRELVAASAFWSVVATFAWATLFAWAGASRGPRTWMSTVATRTLAELRGEAQVSGVWGGVVMLVVAFLLAAAGLLLWVIVALARGAPDSGFGAGDAAAGVLYLIAFLPNLLTALIALALGAPLVHGAQVGVAGRVIGGLQETSLLGPHSLPAVTYLLLLIPIVACSAGGWFLARLRPTRAESWRAVLLAATTFALVLAVLAWIGDARVGAGLIRDRGVAMLAVRAVPTFAWGMLWASVFGWLGWEIAMRRQRG